MGSSKAILLLCYEFPPYPSIGGRRWAKFAKYLAREGHTVHVIAAKIPIIGSKQETNWLKDIDVPNIFTYYSKSNYPYKLLKNKKSVGGRLMRRLCVIGIEYAGMGIIQDKALFWQQGLLAFAKELIAKHDIRNVISTGPPHRVNYYATLLKKDNPGLNIICDFRDTWLDGKVYGLKKISKSVIAAETEMESYTVQHADYLLFTYQPMLQDFAKRYPNLPIEKFKHFPHNYDPEDYPLSGNTKETGGSLSFIYGGTLTATAVRDACIPFLKAVRQLQESGSVLNRNLNIAIFGKNKVLEDAIRALGLTESVKLSDQIPEEQFYSEAAKSNYLLSFLGNDWKDLVTTKNIAYLPIRKPIILVSKRGVVSDFIETNNLGFVINPESCFDDLSQLLTNRSTNGTFGYNRYDITTFSYELAARRLLQLLR